MDLELLRLYAISMIGIPYSYGSAPGSGDDPIGGFDCSGLACELLRASGVVPWDFRVTAQALYDRFKIFSPETAYPSMGDLAFFGRANAVEHVGMCLDRFTMIEAGGGTSATINSTIAASQNAFVRLRPIRFRRDFLTVLKLKYPDGTLST